MYFLFLVSAFCWNPNFLDINELNRILEPFLARNDLIVSVEDELYKFFNNSNVTISLTSDEENYLQIQFNNIKNNVVPECLGRLINITILTLKKNSLNELPKFFAKFTSLCRFNLSSNNFNKLPKVLLLLKNNLTHLYLKSNKFKYLGDDIKNFKKLEILDLSGNDIRTLSEELRSLPKLKVLNLNNNENIIRTNVNDMDHKKDIDFLKKIPKSVKSLYINNIRLRYIICNLKFFPNLHVLYASKNFIKNLLCYCDKCISTYPNDLSSIYSLGKLKELSLRENQIEGSFFIAKNMLMDLEQLDLTLCNITKFEVEGYNIMNSITGKYIKKYENPSTKNRSNPSHSASEKNNSELGIVYSLRYLYITIAKTYVVPNLLIFPNLLYLKIINRENDYFGILSDIVRSLFDGLSKMEFLKYLKLSRFNLITIPNVIYKLQSLEFLLLTRCKVREIQDGIENLLNLTQLSLSYNNIRNINPKIFTLPRPITIILVNNPLDYLPSSINNDNSSFTLKIWTHTLPLFKTHDDNLGIMDISYKKTHQIKGYSFRNMSSMTIEDLYEKAHKEEYKWDLDQMLTIKIKEVEGSQDNYNIIIKYWNIFEKYITDNNIKKKFPNYLQLLYGIKTRRKSEKFDLIESIKNYMEAIFKILTNLVKMGNTENIERTIRTMGSGLSRYIIDQVHYFSYVYHLLPLNENESKSIESFICNQIALLKYHSLREILTNNNEEQKINKFSNWQNKLSRTLGLPFIQQKYGINTNNMFLQYEEYIIYQFFKLMSVENVVKYLYEYINNNPKNVKMVYQYIFSRRQYDMSLQEYVDHADSTKITEQEIYFILEEIYLIKKVENKRTNEHI